MFLCLDKYGLLVRKTAINHIRVISENRNLEVGLGADEQLQIEITAIYTGEYVATDKVLTSVDSELEKSVTFIPDEPWQAIGQL